METKFNELVKQMVEQLGAVAAELGAGVHLKLDIGSDGVSSATCFTIDEAGVPKCRLEHFGPQFWVEHKTASQAIECAMRRHKIDEQTRLKSEAIERAMRMLEDTKGDR
jgi:hypothetical protein